MGFGGPKAAMCEPRNPQLQGCPATLLQAAAGRAGQLLGSAVTTGAQHCPVVTPCHTGHMTASHMLIVSHYSHMTALHMLIVSH